ncbi:hypothetical protein Leryth_008352 [Lithospermum erythrorhizon]|nr:hypothetical protein Leryth_008352 [Lithospermum erythrorhizon]
MAFAMFHFSLVLGVLLLVVVLSNPSQDFDSIGFRNGGGDGEGIEVDFRLFHQDYSPPAPPLTFTPPLPRVVGVEDLGGVGSLDTTCQIVSDLELTRSVYIEGKGSFYILPNVTVQCVSFGCELAVNVGGNFTMGDGSLIYAGTFELVADNVGLGDGSAVDTTGLAGDPPEHTSGTPGRVDGAGGGYGGRGAACLQDGEKIPEDVWGGDMYGWTALEKPWFYGSKGGSTSRETDYGGGGGGRIVLNITKLIEVNGSLLADGGDGGSKGGGGSGGSIYIKAFKMTGSGRVSASGGTGFGGGGGGRVSVDVFSRHDQPKIYVHGGNSLGCPANAGAAGTFYDAVPRSLLVSNYNRSTFTDTPFYEFPQPHMTNVYIRDFGKATVPLLWSRLQVQGQISLLNCGMLSFGLAHYPMSEFEILAEELLMSDSILRVYGALRMSVKMFLMWNSKMLVDGGGDKNVETSFLEASNLIVLKESSIIHSNANLGIHGQGFLNLSGPGDCIEAQRLVLSLFYSINVGPGSILRGPLSNSSSDSATPKLNCDLEGCPFELLHPPEDCNVNSSLSFTLQVCRVEDILVDGLIEGSVVHFHRARAIIVQSSGVISTSGMGCYGDSCVEGGISYGDASLPCELGSGSGNESLAFTTAGGGVLVVGSWVHPLSSLTVEGSVRSDGGSFSTVNKYITADNRSISLGGGSGGSILLFLHAMALGESAIMSSGGGKGSPNGGGGGAGGRIHFHWADIPTGDVYQPIAYVKGSIHTRGGLGGDQGDAGGNGTLTGKACPKGLYGIFCEECPTGTYKNTTGSDKALCFSCPSHELPSRAAYIPVRGGITETPCPYRCVSERHHMPNCYTTLEELIYTFGGPWFFGLLLLGPAPTSQGSQIDHSFPFLESLNEVLETNRVEESQTHVHRLYFMGSNTFSEPWHLPHTPPEYIREIVYEGAFNTFVDEVNDIAMYQWWEGAVHTILCILAYPLAWSWQQWRRKVKLQRLREFVRSEYDHACLRSCRSRALYEGLKVAATSDLMLGYIDFFLGGDEKRSDLPPRLHQRLPISLLFGGDGSYITPFSLHNDNIITSLMSQAVPPTTWYRLVAGLNAQLRLVRRGSLRTTFRPVLEWLETFVNPTLHIYGMRVDLAYFRATDKNHCQYGLFINAIDDTEFIALEGLNGTPENGQIMREHSNRFGHVGEETFLNQNLRSTENSLGQRHYGVILEIDSLKMLVEKRDIFFVLSFLIHNTKPVGHQDLVGLVISMLLLGDFSLVLLTLLQLYSVSMADVFSVLFILPLGILLPFPAGINALFSHGSRRSAGLARLYAVWNIISLINVVVAFICGYIHYSSQSTMKVPFIQTWNMDESEWWIFPFGLVLCKCIQSQLVNWHVANLEIQDRSLYSNDPELFWQSR